jgi:hypothetical protein
LYLAGSLLAAAWRNHTKTAAMRKRRRSAESRAPFCGLETLEKLKDTHIFFTIYKNLCWSTDLAPDICFSGQVIGIVLIGGKKK